MGKGGDGPPSARTSAVPERQGGGSKRERLSSTESSEGAAAPAATWSSGVAFFPPSSRYWRIGGRWYDFSEFAAVHPGGEQAVYLSRDRFEDATFVFESHHHDYKRARAVIRKYEVPQEVVLELAQRRPARGATGVPAGTHFDAPLDRGAVPKLADDSTFYSVLRTRVAAHLRDVGHRDGGPTAQCVGLFWLTFAVWAALMGVTWWTGSFLCALASAWAGAVLGAFGHNWVHQPWYKRWGWALLSLDTLGFSSEAWFREHNLQHHMYTNTPWDNHFKGTDPFLTTDPTVERGFVQRCVTPYINPLILCFGVYGNYIAHTVELLKGREVPSVGKLFLPLHVAVMTTRWGLLHGGALCFAFHALIGVYYFTLALMNHNAEHCMDTVARNAARDWGEAQLASSADWGVDCSFLQASAYLWLNFHTVHHLFPRVDFSHHPAIQQILIRTCKEHGVKYVSGNPAQIYKQMIQTFTTPLSLFREISVYAGGI